MAANQCNHRTCRNPIRSGQKYCYRHGGASASELDAGGARNAESVTVAESREHLERRRIASLQPEWAQMALPPRALNAPTQRGSAVEAYARHLLVDESTASAILDASREVFGRTFLESPADAARQRVKVRDVAQLLRERLGHDRVDIVRVSGLVRKSASRPREVSPDISHEVLLIDKGAESEILVDPFIAAFAPVPRESAARPVAESGMAGVMASPYVDALWMGTRYEYVANGYLEWQSAALVR